MPYPDPITVKSPLKRWKLIEVLRNGEIDGSGEGDASIALGEWDGRAVLAIRWNGDDDSSRGNPQSRGLPTWFILPKWMNATMLAGDAIPDDKKQLVAAHLQI